MTPMSNPLDGNGVAAAEAAFNASINNPQMVPCSKCEGRGFHHGFGEDGNDPDWCTECGGNQFNVVPGEETRAIEAAVAAYLAAAAPSHTAVEPVAELAAFLDEAARYFEKRDTGGEDMAFWANVVNAENCRKAASTLTAQAATVATLKARVAELEAGLARLLSVAEEAAEMASERSDWEQIAYRYGDAVLTARRLTHQEKNNG